MATVAQGASTPATEAGDTRAGGVRSRYLRWAAREGGEARDTDASGRAVGGCGVESEVASGGLQAGAALGGPAEGCVCGPARRWVGQRGRVCV
eukprot:6105472-Prymnesium_polylepis.1